jgi:hypothetical protein
VNLEPCHRSLIGGRGFSQQYPFILNMSPGPLRPGLQSRRAPGWLASQIPGAIPFRNWIREPRLWHEDVICVPSVCPIPALLISLALDPNLLRGDLFAEGKEQTQIWIRVFASMRNREFFVPQIRQKPYCTQLTPSLTSSQPKQTVCLTSDPLTDFRHNTKAHPNRLSETVKPQGLTVNCPTDCRFLR